MNNGDVVMSLQRPSERVILLISSCADANRDIALSRSTTAAAAATACFYTVQTAALFNTKAMGNTKDYDRCNSIQKRPARRHDIANSFPPSISLTSDNYPSRSRYIVARQRNS